MTPHRLHRLAFSPRASRSLFAASILGASLALLASASGCKLMAAGAVLFGNEPTRDVPAEWPHLNDKKIAVAVWAEMDTLFEYPYVQLEIGRHIEDALGPQVKGVTFVPSQQVVQYQQREPNWDRRSPCELGEKLGADRVLFIELTQYTTREPDSPHLFRGRISANVKIFDSTAADTAPPYRTVVETTYPADSTGEYGTDDVSIRKLTMETFAREVAQKFYDRKEKL
ncbi:MAG: hypothetical protein SF069_14765 [Phycisphaerae bacterium]|nr:hypothetical protein [Phycisphaerae bacterium]